jgi:hypothetical protein
MKRNKSFLFFMFFLVIIMVFAGCKKSEISEEHDPKVVTGIGFARKWKSGSNMLATKRSYQVAIEQVQPTQWRLLDEKIVTTMDQLTTTMPRLDESRSVEHGWLVHRISFSIEQSLSLNGYSELTGTGTSTNTPMIAYARAKSDAVKLYIDQTGTTEGLYIVKTVPQFKFNPEIITCIVQLLIQE